MRHQRRRRDFLREAARRPLTRNERVGYPQTKVVGLMKVGAQIFGELVRDAEEVAAVFPAAGVDAERDRV